MTSREETRQKLWCDAWATYSNGFTPQRALELTNVAVKAFDEQFPEKDSGDQPENDAAITELQADLAYLTDNVIQSHGRRIADLESHGVGSMAMVKLTARVYALENAGLPEGIVVTQPEETPDSP